ncbi:MAG: hypothetical protein WA056_02245 [Gallionella sp.]
MFKPSGNVCSVTDYLDEAIINSYCVIGFDEEVFEEFESMTEFEHRMEAIPNPNGIEVLLDGDTFSKMVATKRPDGTFTYFSDTK